MSPKVRRITELSVTERLDPSPITVVPSADLPQGDNLSVSLRSTSPLRRGERFAVVLKI